MILNFSEDDQIQYTVTCTNKSNSSWYFYIFQRIINQPNDNIYSLVWMSSPYKIGVGSFIKFIWSQNYCFSWYSTGKIEVGFVPMSGGSNPAELSVGNSTIFDIKDNTPGFSTPIAGGSPIIFSISASDKIPNNVFSTGIGMSGFTTFIKQSYTNTVQEFSTKSTVWIAATSKMVEPTEILSQSTISNSEMLTFPANIYQLSATLNKNNLWEIE